MAFLEYPFPIKTYDNETYFRNIYTWLFDLVQSLNSSLNFILINGYINEKQQSSATDSRGTSTLENSKPSPQPSSLSPDPYLNPLIYLEDMSSLTSNCQAHQGILIMNELVQTYFDSLIISDGICTTLSALLTKQIIPKISTSDTFSAQIISCEDITPDEIIEFNKHMLYKAAVFYTQIQAIK